MTVRAFFLAFFLDAMTQSADLPGYVCELQVKQGEPLQDLAGIECNVSKVMCNCSSSYFDMFNPVFWTITYKINETINGTEAGKWYLMDKLGRCAASFGTSLSPTKLACPPGFYCNGGLDPPRSCSPGDYCPGQTGGDSRRCPEGNFCPFPASPLQLCMDGGYCPEGSEEPKACLPGHYCKGGKVMDCPSGSYCPFAATEPKKCGFLKLCPPNSSHEDIIHLSAAFLLLCGLMMFLVKRYYYKVVEYTTVVFFILAGVIAVMWVVDQFIGGFLTFIFIAIATNHALVRWSSGRCPAVVPRALVFCTFVTGLYVLWQLNPAWSMLIGGMLTCLTIGWLMSLDYRICVELGRILLLCAMAGLIFVLAHADPDLTAVLAVLLAAGVVWTILSGLVDMCRTRRGREDAPQHSGEESRTVTQDLMQASMDLTGQVLRRDSKNAATSSASASAPSQSANARPSTERILDAEIYIPATAGTGVLFSLQDVTFSLPNGTQLLKGIDLSILRGSRVAVMGPSGSGKSTLLAVLSGQGSYGRVGGRLLVGGEPSKDLGFLTAVMGFVPQDDVLHGELSVEENIRFQASLRLPAGTSPTDVQQSVAQVAKDLNLASIAKARVGTPELRGISGGQRKRVSIAMELVTRPLLLFADEPTSGLDSTTAHEVISCLNQAAKNQGTTVISVIHQPRYETLMLFSDLILLATGGTLVYAGSTEGAAADFQKHLKINFPENANPADVMLDYIQPPHTPPVEALAALRRCGSRGHPEEGRSSRSHFYRTKPPFFRAVVVHMDRAMLQTLCSYNTIIANHVLCSLALFLLCRMIKYERIENFMMQSSFAALFLMLLQGIAGQRIFGADMLNMMREARVGIKLAAYFVAKDLVALFEVTLSAGVFASVYGALSGMQQEVPHLFAGAWAFVYSVFGMSYIFSICLSPGAAQMSAVALTFVSYCVSGIYTPNLPELAAYLGGRGWMVPALSSVRWFWGYLITAEAHYLTPLSRKYGFWSMRDKGYDLDYLDCNWSDLDEGGIGVVSLREAWIEKRGCVCNGLNMLLLGIMLRFLAIICLSLHVYAKTSSWARFFGKYERGAWKLMGRLFALLVGWFLAMVLFVEVWIFGIIHVDVPEFLRGLGIR